ncbi:hypothetical protein [Pantoea sp. R13S299]|uniref:hypothetical protein n=1 Tax=Pantoea sp. R13S299 TaxID=3402751 RepID=UPI003AE5D063
MGLPFTAERDALKIVSEAIDGAESSLIMTAYSFTSKPVAAALMDVKNRGIIVRLVEDKKPIVASTPP